MKPTALLFVFALSFQAASVSAYESVEVTSVEKEMVAQELEKEAASGKHREEDKVFLNKVSHLFRDSKEVQEIEVDSRRDDCPSCERQEKAKNFLTKWGRKLGKGAAWITTTTGKPFMTAAGFVKGAIEKGDKNKELVALYQFFLNHQAEFDDLYLEAGTPEEMVELMIAKMEEIMEKKNRTLIKEFLRSVGIKKEIPADLSDLELTEEEIASIDLSKIDPAVINNHPEYQEVRALLGDVTKDELKDLISSGYFEKSISFDNYKKTLPSIPELVGTAVAQLYAPKIALGVVSNTLAGLYGTTVIGAQIGTGVSTAICLQKDIQAKFEADQDLKMFCSYVVNRTSYQLSKSRAKGYISGKKFHNRVAERIKRFKEKRAEKKKQKELRKKKREEEKAKLTPELS